MYFIYLDESGNTGMNLRDADQPIHFISGVTIPKDKAQKIENSIKSFLPIFLPHSQNYDFEFHGVELFNGKKYFQHYKLQERLNIFEKFVEIAEHYEINFFSQGINKSKFEKKYKTPFHPHNVAFMYLIEKIETYLKEKKVLGMVIMDRCKGLEQKIINDFRYYKDNGTSFGAFKKDIEQFIDNVMYVESFNSYLIQFSDVLSYIYTSNYVSNFLKKPISYHRKFIESLSKRIEKLSKYISIEP